MNFKVGDKIHIVAMDGEPQYTGREGTIKSIDDIGQLHGDWGGLAIDPKIDTVRLIKEK